MNLIKAELSLFTSFWKRTSNSMGHNQQAETSCTEARFSVSLLRWKLLTFQHSHLLTVSNLKWRTKDFLAEGEIDHLTEIIWVWLFFLVFSSQLLEPGRAWLISGRKIRLESVMFLFFHLGALRDPCSSAALLKKNEKKTTDQDRRGICTVVYY